MLRLVSLTAHLFGGEAVRFCCWKSRTAPGVSALCCWDAGRPFCSPLFWVRFDLNILSLLTPIDIFPLFSSFALVKNSLRTLTATINKTKFSVDFNLHRVHCIILHRFLTHSLNHCRSKCLFCNYPKSNMLLSLNAIDMQKRVKMQKTRTTMTEKRPENRIDIAKGKMSFQWDWYTIKINSHQSTCAPRHQWILHESIEYNVKWCVCVHALIELTIVRCTTTTKNSANFHTNVHQRIKSNRMSLRVIQQLMK